ncbi:MULTISPECIES: ATP-binding protein [Achromobacter]|uniref:histidine kinase n=1 Tax=Achromobacter spanius TaxID=217203 RepID=A0AAW3HYA9_9BURK|nr:MULTISPECIES: ATP-binding protein [Achromobacter]KNE25478.1 histidine kinase [Achromobacter spanius]MCD0498112.1 GAF domain-containing protein [Achromobacter sp. MY14]
MNAPTPSHLPVTLANCDSEPIHIPGAIQPLGALLAFDADGMLQFASENAPALLGVPLTLGQCCPPGTLPSDLADYLAEWLGNPDPVFDPFALTLNDATFDVIGHCNSDGLTIIELEQRVQAAADVADPARIYRSIERVRRERDIDGLLKSAVREVRRATGFDRVMAYRFHPDDSGEIVTEERHESLEDWIGRRYPAGDIPAQARRLYTVNTLRQIADARYTPVRVRGAPSATTKPLDMSFSVLRSVSPIHLEYMANMGVQASMSLSIVIGDRLWGMIACHHHGPRPIPYPARLACEALAQVLSAALANIEGAERAAQARRNAALVSELTERASASENLHLALSSGPDTPASLIPNDAALCLWGNSVTVFGGIAPRGELAGILCALDQSGQRLVHTDNIARDYPDLQTDLVPYAGLLACKFDPMNNGWLIWLRKEQIETLVWGGKPEKQYAVGNQGPRLTPRGSFEAWREVVRNTCTSWLPAELEAADNLRDELSHIATSRTADVDRARTALLAMLGHDLRDPLQSISMAATLLSKTDTGARMGERIRYSSGRMQRLISQVLDLSRLQGGMGLGIEKRPCSLSDLINGLIEEKRQAYPGLRIEPDVAPDLTLMADTDRIAQVLTNLMSNARQHGAPRQPILVQAHERGDDIELRVINHGAPIAPEVLAHLFSPFKPESLGQSRNRNGLGLGLYIAEQVVRGHDGEISVACRDGLVIFTVRLPRDCRDAPTL